MSVKSLKKKLDTAVAAIEDEEKLENLLFTALNYGTSEEEETSDDEDDSDDDDDDSDDDTDDEEVAPKKRGKTSKKSTKSNDEEEEEEETEELPTTVKGLTEYIEENYKVDDLSEFPGMAKAKDKEAKIKVMNKFIKAVNASTTKAPKLQKFIEKEEIAFVKPRGKPSTDKDKLEALRLRMAAAILASGNDLP